MNPMCEYAKLICKNLRCGFQSNKKSSIWYCKLCKISEATNEEYEADEIDILEKPNIKNVASVTYNKDNNRFDYGADILAILDIADEETKRLFRERFEEESKTIREESMAFSTSSSNLGALSTDQPQNPNESFEIRAVPRQSIARVPGGPEPIANFVSIRSESDTQFTIVHKEDAQENLTIEIRV